MSSRTEVAPTYALLVDGTTVQIRLAGSDDEAALKRLYGEMSSENRYLRFLGAGTGVGAAAAHRTCRPAGPEHAALLAELAGALVGVAEYEADASTATAEVACAVADRFHGRGVATLLLEHLVALARDRGVRSFTADTLVHNHPMLAVFADMG